MFSAIRSFFVKRKISKLAAEHRLNAKFWEVLAAKAVKADDQPRVEECYSSWKHQLKMAKMYEDELRNL